MEANNKQKQTTIFVSIISLLVGVIGGFFVFTALDKPELGTPTIVRIQESTNQNPHNELEQVVESDVVEVQDNDFISQLTQLVNNEIGNDGLFDGRYVRNYSMEVGYGNAIFGFLSNFHGGNYIVYDGQKEEFIIENEFFTGYDSKYPLAIVGIDRIVALQEQDTNIPSKKIILTDLSGNFIKNVLDINEVLSEGESLQGSVQVSSTPDEHIITLPLEENWMKVKRYRLDENYAASLIGE